MFLYQLAESLPVAFSLAHTHARNVLQLFERNGICHGHLLHRHVLENDVRRHVKPFGHVFTQLFEHDIQVGVEGRTTAVARLFHKIVFKVSVFHNHERLRLLDETTSCGSKFQQAIVLHVLFQVSRDKRLVYHGVPNFVVFVFACTEIFQLVVLVRHKVVGRPTLNEVHNIVTSKIFLYGQNSLQNDEQRLLCLAFGFGVQAIVAVMTIVFRIIFAEIVEQHFAPTHRRFCIGGRF